MFGSFSEKRGECSRCGDQFYRILGVGASGKHTCRRCKGAFCGNCSIANADLPPTACSTLEEAREWRHRLCLPCYYELDSAVVQSARIIRPRHDEAVLKNRARNGCKPLSSPHICHDDRYAKNFGVGLPAVDEGPHAMMGPDGRDDTLDSQFFEPSLSKPIEVPSAASIVGSDLDVQGSPTVIDTKVPPTSSDELEIVFYPAQPDDEPEPPSTEESKLPCEDSSDSGDMRCFEREGLAVLEFDSSVSPVNLEGVDTAGILKQIEFYFSNHNFRHDRYLRMEAAKHPEGFVAVATLATFSRVARFNASVVQIAEVMCSSEVLVLSEDKTMVKRIADDSVAPAAARHGETASSGAAEMRRPADADTTDPTECPIKPRWPEGGALRFESGKESILETAVGRVHAVSCLAKGLGNSLNTNIDAKSPGAMLCRIALRRCAAVEGLLRAVENSRENVGGAGELKRDGDVPSEFVYIWAQTAADELEFIADELATIVRTGASGADAWVCPRAGEAQDFVEEEGTTLESPHEGRVRDSYSAGSSSRERNLSCPSISVWCIPYRAIIWGAAIICSFVLGVYDSLHLWNAVCRLKDACSSKSGRSALMSLLLLNVIFLWGSVALSWLVLPPTSLDWGDMDVQLGTHNGWMLSFGIAARWVADVTFVGTFFALWVLPMFIISVVKSAEWQNVLVLSGYNNDTYDMVLPSRGAATKGARPVYVLVQQIVSHNLYRSVTFISFLVLSFLLSHVPVVGPPLYFLSSCWIYGVYAFEFKYRFDYGVTVQQMFAEFEICWAYFVGFGFFMTVWGLYLHWIANWVLVSLLFPLFGLVALSVHPSLHPPPNHPRLPVSAVLDRLVNRTVRRSVAALRANSPSMNRRE